MSDNMRVVAGVTGIVVGGAICALVFGRFLTKNKTALKQAGEEASEIKETIGVVVDLVVDQP